MTNIEVIHFRKCLNQRCKNFGGKWPAEQEPCPVCGTGGYPIGAVAKNHDAVPEEEPGDELDDDRG